MQREPDDCYAVDYETYYTSSYSLKLMPAWAYVHHPEFDAYLVSVSGPDNFLWVGHPTAFDWKMLNGKTVLHHNAQFDALVSLRLVNDGVIPPYHPKAVHDTSDLARFLQMPAALKDFAKRIWGLDDIESKGKAARERMKNTPVSELMSDPDIVEYAANDAVLCRRLWLEFSDQWPENERELSRLNREACFYGVAIDREYVELAYNRLAMKLYDAGRAIPWDWEGKKTPLSRTKIIENCRNTVVEDRLLTAEETEVVEGVVDDLGNQTRALIALWKKQDEEWSQDFCRLELETTAGGWGLKKFMWYPASFAKDDPDCQRWEDQYGDAYPWIGALRDWRRINILFGRFQHLREFTGPDGLYHPQLKYCGARTGRFSGDGAFNCQSMPSKEMFCDLDAEKQPIPGTGADLRRCFVARPGKILCLTDFAQVEARALVAIVKDERILPKLRAGMSIYQAYAEAWFNRTWGDLKKENYPLYAAVKMMVLLSGYGGGGKKIANASRQMTKDDPNPEGRIDWTEAEGREKVAQYRAENPGVVALWQNLDRRVRSGAELRRDVVRLRLHSGRDLCYWEPRYRLLKDEEKVQLMAMFTKNSPSSYRRAWGGLLVENCTQAICRDVLRDGWIALNRAGYRVLWSVHDEFIIELPEDETEEGPEKAILENIEPWAQFIPLAVESKLTPHYTK